MKIAVVGAGISGLSCAWALAKSHQVTLFEEEDYLGGHTHTIDITVDGVTGPIDTGFLVYNERTYPQLIALFETLGVETALSDMSFSVSVARRGAGALEWAGHDLNSVFAQRRNLLNPRFVRMVVEILRFNRLATSLINTDLESRRETLGEFLLRYRFSAALKDWYLLPMAAAIWSCSTEQMGAFPLSTFLRFCHNHGLLQVNDRPQWRTVVGGAREYVRKIERDLGAVRRAEKVLSIERSAAGVSVRTAQRLANFDEVVLACHSDQALSILEAATIDEKNILGAISYQPNHAIVHTDAALLPHEHRTWAAWNYQCAEGDKLGQRSVCVHYLINRLQPVPFRRPIMVSLNTFTRPREEAILAEFDYAHPVFDRAAIDAQRRLPEIQGKSHVWFAGAWTGYGFHEDGLKSGLAVAAALDTFGISSDSNRLAA